MLTSTVFHNGNVTHLTKGSLEGLKEFMKPGVNPFIAFLTKLNDYCFSNKTTATLDIDDYKFEHFQEGDKQGWTLVYKGKRIIAYINWQACGCYVETIDEEFKNFLIRNARDCDRIIHGLDDPQKVEESSSYWEEVFRIVILKMEMDGTMAETFKSIQEYK